MSLSFLMCSERSGSNLITQLINSHNDICGPSTKHILNPVARNLFRYKDISKLENWNSLLGDIHTLISSDFSIWKSQPSLADIKNLASTGEISYLLKELFHLEARAHNKSHVFIKENQLYEFLSFILINFPDSKFLYQVRDPRDMALSWKKNKNHAGGVYKAALQWSYDQKRYLCDFYSLQKIDKAYLIRYEELISSPENTLQEVLPFLGHHYHKDMLNFYNNELTVENSKKQEAWNNLAKPILTNNYNKFLSELTSQEISIIEKICFYEMKALGYEPIINQADLEKITPEEIKYFSDQEDKLYPAIRSQGTIDNMEAKKNFYLR